MTDNTFYNVKDLQTTLKIGRDKAYRLMASKDFPSMRIGKNYVVSSDAFQRWVKESENREIRLE
ncbi:MAG: helix-turn-helix domain-containing protein [Lachnospiraceae bacterium]|nr:helix-turn-helix domain-containing protein [Lachnospiraceae bacterium]